MLDRNPTDNALEIVVSFAPLGGGGNAASAKSEIIEAVYDAVEAPPAQAQPAEPMRMRR